MIFILKIGKTFIAKCQTNSHHLDNRIEQHVKQKVSIYMCVWKDDTFYFIYFKVHSN